MFNSEAKEQRRQFETQIAVSDDANDTEIMKVMQDPSRIAYDPQVSAMLIEVSRRFLNWKVEQVKDADGKIQSYLVCKEVYPYKEPYGDEALAFMSDVDEKALLNQFGDSLSLVKMFADKYNLDWSLPFNQMVTVRENFLLNSRTTGKGSKLAKSQLTESTASIRRELAPQKKKGFLDGIFG